MASDTKNVKLGVCKVLYDGVDLGYTKGGVDVTVKSETHKVMIDQFGKSPVNEYVMGREVTVKCPLAETTLTNLVAIMPGATLSTDGVKAAGAVTFTGQPAIGDTLTIGATAFTFKAAAAVANDIAIGATLTATLASAVAVINAALASSVVTASSATVLSIAAVAYGVVGNAIVLAKVGVTASVSAATLIGGIEPTKSVVTVTNAVGTNLLDIAKALVLHPVSKLDTDKSEDFTVFKAATAGALNFAYKLEDERIFNCEFNGYPDVANGSRLFAVGDTSVVV